MDAKELEAREEGIQTGYCYHVGRLLPPDSIGRTQDVSMMTQIPLIPSGRYLIHMVPSSLVESRKPKVGLRCLRFNVGPKARVGPKPRAQAVAKRNVRKRD